jgi:hypothetical protein
MIALLCFVLAVLVSPFKSKSQLEAENAALRHQVVVFGIHPKLPAKSAGKHKCVNLVVVLDT